MSAVIDLSIDANDDHGELHEVLASSDDCLKIVNWASPPSAERCYTVQLIKSTVSCAPTYVQEIVADVLGENVQQASKDKDAIHLSVASLLLYSLGSCRLNQTWCTG